MSRLPVYALAKDLRQAIEQGHPWLYDRALQRVRARVEPGQLVEIRYRKDAVAVAYADPERPIAARILAVDGDARAAAGRAPDDWLAAMLAERVRAAARCRLSDPRLAASDAWRIVHGENDYLPGLVVDLYATAAVVAFDGPGAFALWAPRWPIVLRSMRAAGLTVEYVWARTGKNAGKNAGATVPAVRFAPGDAVEPPEVITIHEHGATFEVDVRRGHKTGLFLDQRDNRALVRQMAAGASALDICAYAGMFAVNAALGGATQVTAVDISAPALAAARRNFVINGLGDGVDEGGDYRFVVADAFEFLEQAAASGRRYDLVIVDPPSFAPSERARKRALESYRRLDRLALAVVEPGGWLMTASCSSHIATDDSLRVLHAAARDSGRRLRVTDIRGAASDHPTLPGFPEGRYLSFVVAAVV